LRHQVIKLASARNTLDTSGRAVPCHIGCLFIFPFGIGVAAWKTMEREQGVEVKGPVRLVKPALPPLARCMPALTFRVPPYNHLYPSNYSPHPHNGSRLTRAHSPLYISTSPAALRPHRTPLPRQNLRDFPASHLPTLCIFPTPPRKRQRPSRREHQHRRRPCKRSWSPRRAQEHKSAGL